MRANGREKKWETRRAKVISQIKDEKVDVVGLQEASPGLLKGTKISQFEDLANRLGGAYRLTNDKRYGCAKSTSYKKCKKVNQLRAAADVRIVYNSNRLSLLDHGSKQLDNEKATSGPRFVAWAIFKDRTDGRRFSRRQRPHRARSEQEDPGAAQEAGGEDHRRDQGREP